MPHQCQDCSYTRDNRFPSGKCPACGSYNITGKQAIAGVEDKPRRFKNARLITVIVLWLFLFYLLYDKLLA